MDTIVHVVAAHAARQPDALFARFVHGEEPPFELTYAALWEAARRWAACFDDSGVQPGQPVILSLHNEADFVTAYFGALIAEAVPTPVAPLTRADSSDPRARMIAGRLAFLRARHVVLPQDAHDIEAACTEAAPPGTVVLTGERLPSAGRPVDLERIGPEALGLIQFSSGTLGASKAVELTHRALLSQARTLNAIISADRDSDSAVSWLPFFHDMGLIGLLLAPAYLGVSVTILRTESFLRNPRVWLRAVSHYRASVTAGPPSAYGLVARFVREGERRDYDLSSVRAALVAAETIEPATMRAFATAFAPSGFRAETLMPSYGLAENALAVTTTPLGSGMSVDVIDPGILRREGRAQPANDSAAQEITSVGKPVPGTEVAIADASGRHLEERHLGEILVRSASLMRGYHGSVESAVRDGWLWTGDVGYLADGRLYITGRAKELIIVGGSNYFPDDLERVAGSVTGVRQGRAVAFSVPSPEKSTESVIVLVETSIRDRDKRDRLRLDVRGALTAAGLPINEVGLVAPRFIRSTDTGKVRRMDSKQSYLDGERDGPS